ncbi:hypothetical protein [Longirhabdus pacifica]|uniref:hypothetical protein n=1 Tax=Longirhabdus pacifica TaxID=2305227 RepID=UPI00197F3C65|nr:hypothetical protein [Longirhabdus pacifica]
MFTCNICAQLFESKAELLHHIKKAHHPNTVTNHIVQQFQYYFKKITFPYYDQNTPNKENNDDHTYVTYTEQRTQHHYNKTEKKHSNNQHVNHLFADTRKLPHDISSAHHTQDKVVPVYILLTHTGTVLANTIKSITRAPYSHVSISFDSSLSEMYSFGRKNPSNPFIGGFVKESIHEGIYCKYQDTIHYSLYVTFVSEQQKRKMINKLNYFKDNKHKWKYNFYGLFKNLAGKESEENNAYFCSQFVSFILNSSGSSYFKQHPSLVRPFDFTTNKYFTHIDKGFICHFDGHNINTKVHHMLYDTIYEDSAYSFA